VSFSPAFASAPCRAFREREPAAPGLLQAAADRMYPLDPLDISGEYLPKNQLSTRHSARYINAIPEEATAWMLW
jgi:hypothetical protein